MAVILDYFANNKPILSCVMCSTVNPVKTVHEVTLPSFLVSESIEQKLKSIESQVGISVSGQAGRARFDRIISTVLLAVLPSLSAVLSQLLCFHLAQI